MKPRALKRWQKRHRSMSRMERHFMRQSDYCETLGKRGCDVGVRRSGRTIHYHIPRWRPMPRPWKLAR